MIEHKMEMNQEHKNINMQLQDAEKIYLQMKTRRSVRHFSNENIPVELIQWCIRTASTAPSGANSQPWFFSVVQSQKVKKLIRLAAEQEEKKFYEVTATDEVLCDLKPFGTNWQKPHLEDASALIIIFAKNYEYVGNQKKKCYYPKESVGIATGFLITALHQLGLSTLTHTPQPMSFLNDILQRPKNEKAFLILAVGKPHPNYSPPELVRKDLKDICEVI